MRINQVTKGMKLDLMNNFRDKLQEIDLKTYVDDINVNWDDISTMTLSIPSRLNIDGIMVDNNDIYRKFKGKKQQLKLINPDIRFVIDEISTKREKINGRYYNEKTIKCKSYESTLDIDLILGEDIVRQLYNDGEDSLDVSEGVLNMFESRTGWKVKHVSENARKTFGKALIQRELPIGTNYNLTNVQKEQVIWEKDLNITPFDEHSTIGLNIVYSGLETKNNEGKVQASLSPFSHNLSNLYTTVTHIKAMYTKNNEGQYGITYEITYADGNQVQKRIDDFVFCDGLNLKIDEIKLGYTNGEQEETMTIKYATFEQGSYKWLDFLRKTVAKAYDDLYFKFDTINKEVSVYLKSEYGENHGGIVFSYDTFVSEINEIEQSDEIITKLYVNSQNTSIVDVNPLGTEFIYCFDYFIENELMDDDLIESWRRYETHINNSALELYNLRVESNTINKDIIVLDSEVTALDYSIGVLTRRRSSYQVDNNDGQYDNEIRELSTQIIEKQTKLESILSKKAQLQLDLEKIMVQLQNLVKSIQIETAEDANGKIFTEIQIQDLNDLMITQTVEDSNFVTSNGLYEYYKDDLIKRNKHHIDFEITSEDFLQNIIVPPKATWDYFLEVGNFVYTDDESIIKDEDNKLRIISYKILPKDNDIKDIKLNNRDKQVDEYSGGSVNLKSDVGRASGYVNMFNSTWKESPNVNSFINSMLGDGLNASLVPLRNRSTRCKFDFTEAGLIIMDAEDENKQLMLTSNILAFTNDRFLTSKCAINEEGITAKWLIGEIVLGKVLYICNDDGKSFYIGNLNSEMKPDNNGEDFGMQISDRESSRERIFIGIRNGLATLRLYGDDGEAVITEKGIIQTYQYIHSNDLDSGNPLEFTHIVDDGVNEIRKVYINVTFQQFRATVKSLSSGGTIGTSSEGGYTSKSTNNGGYTSKTESTRNSGYFSQYTDSKFAKEWQNSTVSVSNNEVRTELFGHRHQVEISLPVHSHEVPIVIPAHSHSFVIENHTHKLDFSHNHTLTHGIYLSSLPSGVKLYVNNQLVSSNVLDNQSINIENYLRKGNNEIKFTSTTLGRLQLTVFSKCFVSY